MSGFLKAGWTFWVIGALLNIPVFTTHGHAKFVAFVACLVTLGIGLVLFIAAVAESAGRKS